MKASNEHIPKAEALLGTGLVVVDLEATCWREGNINASEIIEIGAVRLTPAGAPADRFQTFVRPVEQPVLSEFCVQLTHIQQVDVDAAPTFPAALEAFADWADAAGPYVLASWGEYDKNQLRRDCHRHGVTYPFGRHVNLKKVHAQHVGASPCGMARALAQAGLPLLGTHHRGIDDAVNIARILRWMWGLEAAT
jgi:3'-5' exoribonuclease 1